METYVEQYTHTSLIKNDELIYMTVCVCLCVRRGGCVCLLWEVVDGKGRAVFGLVSFFHLKIRASPGNKGEPN